MWVICFYLNAHKNAFSETVIRGCGSGDKRERKEMSFIFFCSPALLSQQLVVVRQVLLVPAASFGLSLS